MGEIMETRVFTMYRPPRGEDIAGLVHENDLYGWHVDIDRFISKYTITFYKEEE